MKTTITLIVGVLAFTCALISAARSPISSIAHEVPEVAPSFSLYSATGEASGPSNACSWSYTPAGASTINYDLSGMTKTQGDYTGQDTAYNYKANVCAKANASPVDKDYSICQYNQETSTFVASLGSYTSAAPVWSLIQLPNKTPEPYTAGIMYSMTNGDVCFIAGREQQRTALNVFRCATAPSDIITIDEDPTTCTFTVTYQSTQACGGSGPTPTPSTGSSGGSTSSKGLSGGWIFIIILLVVIPIYIGVGCLYKVKRGGAAFGRDACPNGEFWGAIPGYTKDGFKFTFNLIRSGCKSGRGTTETYNQI